MIIQRVRSTALTAAAFTLIELLVVIAIIAIMASMLLPALSKVAVLDTSNEWQPQLSDNPVQGCVRNYLYLDDLVVARKPCKPGLLRKSCHLQ